MTTTTSPIGSAIRARRQALGLSQARLADKLRVPATTVGMWERGRAEPSETQIAALGDALALTGDTVERWRMDVAGPRPVDVEIVHEGDTGPVAPVLLHPTVDPPSGPRRQQMRRFRRGPRRERRQGAPGEAPSATEEEGTFGSQLLEEPEAVRRTEPAAVFPDPAARSRVEVLYEGEVTPYLSSPSERWVYRLRWLAVAVVLVTLTVLLVWAAGELLSGLGQMDLIVEDPTLRG